MNKLINKNLIQDYEYNVRIGNIDDKVALEILFKHPRKNTSKIIMRARSEEFEQTPKSDVVYIDVLCRRSLLRTYWFPQAPRGDCNTAVRAVQSVAEEVGALENASRRVLAVPAMRPQNLRSLRWHSPKCHSASTTCPTVHATRYDVPLFLHKLNFSNSLFLKIFHL